MDHIKISQKWSGLYISTKPFLFIIPTKKLLVLGTKYTFGRAVVMVGVVWQTLDVRVVYKTLHPYLDTNPISHKVQSPPSPLDYLIK
jgi:hypothetical protein